MAKVLAIIKGDPVLEEICTSLQESRDRVKQRVAFLQKQADDLCDQAQKEDEPLWQKMAEYLQSKGVIQSYNRHEASLTFSLEDNCVELVPQSEKNNPLKFLDDLFRGNR